MSPTKCSHQQIGFELFRFSQEIELETETKLLPASPKWRRTVASSDTNKTKKVDCNGLWSLFFIDLEKVLRNYEQHKSSNDIGLKEKYPLRFWQNTAPRAATLLLSPNWPYKNVRKNLSMSEIYLPEMFKIV